MSIKLIADSTCDLPKELIQKYDIGIIPLHIIMGENQFDDGVDISYKEIFDWVETNKNLPKTSTANYSEVADIIIDASNNYDSVICITLSSELSSTYNVFKLVADDMEKGNVYVIDSRSLSSGFGLMVMRAAELIRSGYDVKYIISELENFKSKIQVTFIVDSLDYLKYGGRVSNATALMGGALRIHPRLEVDDGALKAGKKYRGKFESVARNYLFELAESLNKADKSQIFITHADCPDNIIYDFYRVLDKDYGFENISSVNAGSVIASHCGPGTVGIIFAYK